MSTATADFEILSPECDNGRHGNCTRREDCACICHASDEEDDPEDDDY
jgi:hypothetical protein